MDQKKTGALIRMLRQEKGLTQRQVAQALAVDHRAVSKWERDLLVLGELTANDKDGGNMKRVKLYVCPVCGNLLTATSPAELSCCGRRLEPLVPQKADADHACTVEEIEDDWYVTFSHPMEKDHYIRFAAYVSYDRILLIKLYPEQGGEVRFPRMHGGTLYLCCSQHGLFAAGR